MTDQKATLQAIAAPAALGARVTAAMAAALFGVLLLYGAGFAAPNDLHNAAHDGRHAFTFPCH